MRVKVYIRGYQDMHMAALDYQVTLISYFPNDYKLKLFEFIVGKLL